MVTIPRAEIDAAAGDDMADFDAELLDLNGSADLRADLSAEVVRQIAQRLRAAHACTQADALDALVDRYEREAAS